MKEYQQRVVGELNELESKTIALNRFVSSYSTFLDLEKDEQERLKIQLDTMWLYVEILRERIAAFK